ncbi:hypothetical protein [uncultured Roseibium sp.]|uniref:hypothetical protein n=1 Tax=uncultured Roseibium sp. TaxID=1936171 RepID=UPI0026348C5D|nr:hypothetical protein [uncultured Roseibium sp.]
MKLLLGLIFIFAVGPGLFLMDGSIIKDFKLRSETLSYANIPTSERRCRTRVLVFQSCNYKYVHEQQEHKQSYIFFALGAPETVVLLRGNASGELTSSVGQDYFWNRILTIFLCMGIVVWAIAQGMLQRRAQAAPRKLRQPVKPRHAVPSTMPRQAAPPAMPRRAPTPHPGRVDRGATFGKRR